MAAEASWPAREPAPADWEQCAQIAREHGRTFHFASRCLPPPRRRGALAAYAYCRIADDLVDAATETGAEASALALERWEAEIDRPRDPVAVAFAATREHFAIPAQPVHDLIAGIRRDLTTTRYATWAALHTYCYLVAGTVGLMVAPILGCRDPRALGHAANLGIAMQLTNILRDVAEDAERGRLYLPLDETAAFGCDPEAILAGRPGPGFRDLIAYQIERARALYADAHRGFPALAPSGRLTALAAGRLYAGILAEIEALDYDVFQRRAHVSSAGKLRALPGIAAAFTRLSLTPADPADGAAPVHPGLERSGPAEVGSAAELAAVPLLAAATETEHPSYG